jgi:hypothetical protein
MLPVGALVEGYPRFTWLYDHRRSAFSGERWFPPDFICIYDHKHVPTFVLRSRDFDLHLYRFLIHIMVIRPQSLF